MHNGDLVINRTLWLVVGISSAIKALIASVLFTAVTEIESQPTRTIVWVFAMLIIFNIVYKIYKMKKFLDKFKKTS